MNTVVLGYIVNTDKIPCKVFVRTAANAKSAMSWHLYLQHLSLSYSGVHKLRTSF